MMTFLNITKDLLTKNYLVQNLPRECRDLSHCRLEIPERRLRVGSRTYNQYQRQNRRLCMNNSSSTDPDTDLQGQTIGLSSPKFSSSEVSKTHLLRSHYLFHYSPHSSKGPSSHTHWSNSLNSIPDYSSGRILANKYKLVKLVSCSSQRAHTCHKFRKYCLNCWCCPVLCRTAGGKNRGRWKEEEESSELLHGPLSCPRFLPGRVSTYDGLLRCRKSVSGAKKNYQPPETG